MRDAVAGHRRASLVSSWRASPGRLRGLRRAHAARQRQRPARRGVPRSHHRRCARRAAAVAGSAPPSPWPLLASAQASTMEHFAHIFFMELADLHRDPHRAGDRCARPGHHRPGPARTPGLRGPDAAAARGDRASWPDGVQTVLTAFVLLVADRAHRRPAGRPASPGCCCCRCSPCRRCSPGMLAERRQERAELATAEATRLGWHLLDLAVSPAAGKEIRLFGLQRPAAATATATLRRAVRDAGCAGPRLGGLALRLVGQLLFAIGYVGAVVIVVRAAIAGQRSRRRRGPGHHARRADQRAGRRGGGRGPGAAAQRPGDGLGALAAPRAGRRSRADRAGRSPGGLRDGHHARRRGVPLSRAPTPTCCAT